MYGPTIFPLATGWDSTATIVAELHDGKVRVYYDTHRGANRPEFQHEMATLRQRFGDDDVFNGMILEPDEVVSVKLYDQDGAEFPVPAIQLIDFFNQQKQDTLGKIKAVSMLAATVGLGGVGAGGILGWADTATFAISAGSLFINTYRNEIAKTEFGRRFLVGVGRGDRRLLRLGADGRRRTTARTREGRPRAGQLAPRGAERPDRRGACHDRRGTAACPGLARRRGAGRGSRSGEGGRPDREDPRWAR
jgi:hypothetical protein